MTDVPVLATIVEGHGELKAVPVLLRRIALEIYGTYVEVPPPFRLRRSQMTDADLVSRAARVASARISDRGVVMIIADGDDDCAVEFAQSLRLAASPVPVEAAIAVREFEAWFLAAGESLRGHRSVNSALHSIEKSERLSNPKAKMDEFMSEGYRAIIHQPAFAALMDLSAARRCRSFEHLVTCVGRAVS